MYQADTMNAVEGKIITGLVNACKVSAIKSLKYTQRFTSKLDIPKENNRLLLLFVTLPFNSLGSIGCFWKKSLMVYSKK